MSERKKLKVKSVGTPRKVGSSQVTEFKAENDNTVYEVWGAEPLEVVKPGADIEVEIAYSEKEGKDGTLYKHHKIVWLNGQSLLQKKSGGYGGRSYGGKSPEEVASIEAQVAVKAVIVAFTEEQKLGGKSPPRLENIYNKALDWCDKKIDAGLKQKPAQTTTRQPQAAKEQPQTAKQSNGNGGFANAGEFLTKAKEELGLNRSGVLEALGLTDLDGIDYNETYRNLVQKMSGAKSAADKEFAKLESASSHGEKTNG